MQVVFKKLYPKEYTPAVSTRVSNSLLIGKPCSNKLMKHALMSYLIGAIIGQIFVGLICDRVGRKVALIATTLLIVIGCEVFFRRLNGI